MRMMAPKSCTAGCSWQRHFPLWQLPQLDEQAGVMQVSQRPLKHFERRRCKCFTFCKGTMQFGHGSHCLDLLTAACINVQSCAVMWRQFPQRWGWPSTAMRCCRSCRSQRRNDAGAGTFTFDTIHFACVCYLDNCVRVWTPTLLYPHAASLLPRKDSTFLLTPRACHTDSQGSQLGCSLQVQQFP